MKIPFTRDGKLDDTYDTKDGILYLYAKSEMSGSTVQVTQFYTDSSLSQKCDNAHPISNKDVYNYLLLGKCRIIATGSAGFNRSIIGFDTINDNWDSNPEDNRSIVPVTVRFFGKMTMTNMTLGSSPDGLQVWIKRP